MKSVTRYDIAKKVSDLTGLSWLDVDDVVKHAIDVIAGEVATGKCVQFRNLGSFEFRERLGRIRCNPRNPVEKVEVPSHFAVVFNPSTDLKMRVRRLKADQVTPTRTTFAGRRKKEQA